MSCIVKSFLFLCNFVTMKKFVTQIYTSGDVLPIGLLKENFFHSREFYELIHQTPRQRPYMVTVETADGTIVSQLLALVRYRSSLFPPYFYMHCLVLGEGAYRRSDGTEVNLYGHFMQRTEAEVEEHSMLFEMMLEALRNRMGRHLLYIEVSHLSQKMFGYRAFRTNGFFPVKWMNIHNSLHSREPEERVGKDVLEKVNAALGKGVVSKEVVNEDDFKMFIYLLKRHNWFKPRRYMPADDFFRGLIANKNAKLFITTYHHHVIGCSAIAFSQGQAYLWYSAFRRKSFAHLHPAEVTIWNAIKDAHRTGCEHIRFFDVGLPFKKNLYRDFILSFGGKPVSTFRWFRFSIGWLNKLLNLFYS